MIPQFLRTIRNYYSYYKEFNEVDYENILKNSYENDVLPYFLSMDELLNLVIKRKRIGAKFGVDIDISMEEAIEELDKRLKYIKY